MVEDMLTAIDSKSGGSFHYEITNCDRSVGARVSGEIAKRHGNLDMETAPIKVRFTGTAGQSFGVFNAGGLHMYIEGDANDYVGKGLSGGRVIIYPPKNSTFEPAENILIGNVGLYGATAGEAFFRGRAAERFCVRNSGAVTVIEGVGDHGCEYMTGGRTVILGPTGRNFAAGMSGGIAYIWDPEDQFLTNCNLGMVELERVELEADIDELASLIRKHQAYTGSTVAEDLLDRWDQVLPQFVKVMPTDYKRVLLERQKSAPEPAAV